MKIIASLEGAPIKYFLMKINNGRQKRRVDTIDAYENVTIDVWIITCNCIIAMAIIIGKQ